MKTNSFELQVEIYEAVLAGTSKKDLWENLRVRKEELKHLCQGGNPSHNDYRAEMSNVGGAIRSQCDEADELGRFALTDMKLRYDAIRIAGEVSRAIMDLTPANATDATDIRAAYQALQGGVNQEALRDCDVILDDAFKSRLDALYGVKEAPAAEDDA